MVRFLQIKFAEKSQVKHICHEVFSTTFSSKTNHRSIGRLSRKVLSLETIYFEYIFFYLGKNVTEVYENWAYNEPDNAEGNEGCVVMQKDGTLKDESCINKYRSICKKTVETVTWNDECHLAYMGMFFE